MGSLRWTSRGLQIDVVAAQRKASQGFAHGICTRISNRPQILSTLTLITTRTRVTWTLPTQYLPVTKGCRQCFGAPRWLLLSRFRSLPIEVVTSEGWNAVVRMLCISLPVIEISRVEKFDRRVVRISAFWPEIGTTTIGDSLDGAATGLLLHVALETLSWKISDALRINVDVSIGENVGPLATSWAYRMH
jgi:hypothetical protein